jgi:hypothetical protein
MEVLSHINNPRPSYDFHEVVNLIDEITEPWLLQMLYDVVYYDAEEERYFWQDVIVMEDELQLKNQQLNGR